MNRTIFQTFLLLSAFCAGAVFSGEAPTPGETPAKPETSAPATVPDAKNMPVFPITSPDFADIDDEKAIPYDGSAPEATFYRKDMLRKLIPALQNSTQEHLKANIDKNATFKKIFNHPEEFRGHVVQFESTLKFIYEHPDTVTDDKGNTISLARGHASTSYQPITYLSLEPLPDGIKIDDPVLVTGIFLQRFAYENRNMPGRELTWTPLIVCKKLERMVVKEEPPTSNAYIIGDVVFAMVAVGLLLLYANRQSGRVIRSNVFTRIKSQRDGGDRQFPGPRR